MGLFKMQVCENGEEFMGIGFQNGLIIACRPAEVNESKCFWQHVSDFVEVYVFCGNRDVSDKFIDKKDVIYSLEVKKKECIARTVLNRILTASEFTELLQKVNSTSMAQFIN